MDTFPYLKNTLNEKNNQYFGRVDETAWCACFVNWCLKQAGKAGGPSAKAETWKNYGKALDTPVPGAITVLFKLPKPKKPGEDSPSGFHVGDQLIAYRWPL